MLLICFILQNALNLNLQGIFKTDSYHAKYKSLEFSKSYKSQLLK